MISAGVVPMGQFLGNEDPHNFASLGREYLQAAKHINTGFNGVPMWPTYTVAFQSLENFLKAYLLARCGPVSANDYMQHLQFKIGHKLCDALSEAKTKGFVVPADPVVEKAVMEVSRYYTSHDFRYRSSGQWELVSPAIIIAFVDAISHVVNY